MKLLAFDTATEKGSAALWIDGALRFESFQPGADHAAMLLPAIDRLLAQAGCGLRQLDALAFGRGPGAFTGVRLAASVAQGLAFAADLPVLPVSDLAALALAGFEHTPRAQAALVCMDARMGEVYCAAFARTG
ncbi:MAG: tRNA (adenosine(37)-N6)-threonylcarbamoyltransferase complex dimerization subunit type 1 TsaB, partial [Steroidobacteraceae bacterium]|nr:tRNA (adenosine(37)-N6)-threonylcarbamoyltransferase complex dimerization subunit type 1 TsaB [Steroidobacteraceae bacterium]MDW8259267.1 tRNA (adenosine(37)-N6)-threonylcarbamoyltransferase complex dimerization subunit type 1 TsaB [Gammaproteobacteria bacterium]